MFCFRRNKELIHRKPQSSLLLRRQAFANTRNSAMTTTQKKDGKDGKMKALKMSIIHVVTFVLSWTPYTFMATWWEVWQFLSFSWTSTRQIIQRCLISMSEFKNTFKGAFKNIISLSWGGAHWPLMWHSTLLGSLSLFDAGVAPW